VVVVVVVLVIVGHRLFKLRDLVLPEICDGLAERRAVDDAAVEAFLPLPLPLTTHKHALSYTHTTQRERGQDQRQVGANLPA